MHDVVISDEREQADDGAYSHPSLFTALLQRDAVKAMTLTQPWATLMSLGKKRIETRSWKVDYQGPVAIHSAKGFPAWAEAYCEEKPFGDVLDQAGYRCCLDRYRKRNVWDLPLGGVVAVGWLEQVERITDQYPVSSLERSFGNYAPGRFAWRFSEIYSLAAPIEVSGSLGLWTWQPPEAFWNEIQAQHEQEVRQKLPLPLTEICTQYMNDQQTLL